MKTGMTKTAEIQLWPLQSPRQECQYGTQTCTRLGLFSTRTEKEILQLKSFI